MKDKVLNRKNVFYEIPMIRPSAGEQIPKKNEYWENKNF